MGDKNGDDSTDALSSHSIFQILFCSVLVHTEVLQITYTLNAYDIRKIKMVLAGDSFMPNFKFCSTQLILTLTQLLTVSYILYVICDIPTVYYLLALRSNSTVRGILFPARVLYFTI